MEGIEGRKGRKGREGLIVFDGETAMKYFLLSRGRIEWKITRNKDNHNQSLNGTSDFFRPSI